MISSFENQSPIIPPGVFIAHNATVIGKVEIGEGSSVWYNCILRGDVDWIRIGKRTNVQDGGILHCSTGLGPTIVGDDVTIGHSAVVHSCSVESNSLIGIGAIVLDQAIVRTNVVVAAGSLVPPRMELESGFMYAGVPAKKIRPLTGEEIASLKMSALHYTENAAKHKAL